MKYDVIIIGAGLSGLAAGIRLAHYGSKVCILERHSLIGGLNSFYRKGGREFDVGLHAVTNFTGPEVRQAPLNKLLRQLRLARQDLDICEQQFSSICFPQTELRFSNDYEQLEAAVAGLFPAQIDAFRKLVACVKNHDALSLQAEPLATRAVLDKIIPDKILQAMILCPVMYYGNAGAHDMDFNQFCIMFRSIFLEGFWRPRHGIRTILELLRGRYLESGGELRTNCGVRTLSVAADRVCKVVLQDDACLETAAVLSSAGYVETLRLCNPVPVSAESHPVGQMSFTESIFVLDTPAADLGLRTSINFFSKTNDFAYRPAVELMDRQSGVLCVPANFQRMPAMTEGQVRLTHQASYDKWNALAPEAYLENKQMLLDSQIEVLDTYAPGIDAHIIDKDMFTPLTVQRFTGHINGAVYGSPQKHRDGRTPLRNLFICGTDQGFLGIVGAMLSGISMANLHLLR